MFVLQWNDMRIDGVFHATPVADEVIRIISDYYCTDHTIETLMRLDFSELQHSDPT